MPVVPNIDIVESVEDLKELMKQQKSSLAYAKVQSLYFLKMGEVETVRHLAVLMGRGERTIHRWLSFYKKRRNRAIIIWRKPTRKTEKDFVWLSVVRDISVSYTTVYRLVRQEFEAQLKVPRPRNPRQLPGEVDEFKANLSKGLKALLDRESEKVKRYEKVSFWCEDESRFGGNTIARNKITLFGVKPIGNFQYN